MAYNTTQAGRTDTLAPESVPMQFVEGKVVLDGTAITTTDYSRFAIGFKPKYIKVVNITDRIQIEWFEGMTSAQALLTVAAGTRTLDTTAAQVVVDDRGFSILQDGTVAIFVASKTICFIAYG